MVKITYRDPWDMPVGFDDSHPERNRARLAVELAGPPTPTAAPANRGCVICGSVEVSLHNDRGRFCPDHERRGYEWPA